MLPIMPALCSMPACTYYASNYASILGSGLLAGHSVNGLELGKLVKVAYGLLETLRNLASRIPDSKRFQYLIYIPL